MGVSDGSVILGLALLMVYSVLVFCGVVLLIFIIVLLGIRFIER